MIPAYIITYCIMPGKRPSVTQLWFLWHFADTRLLPKDSFALFFRSLQLSQSRQADRQDPALPAASARGEGAIVRGPYRHSKARALGLLQLCR